MYRLRRRGRRRRPPRKGYSCLQGVSLSFNSPRTVSAAPADCFASRSEKCRRKICVTVGL
ncbi:unnamed protein product [Spirodela intermedia]|uniref:Uncharacterized protein n=1 Tax=Spirodela intermedia TaxID=51605 RepID=A0ABN7ECV2_SPIIN|nr:unnamed protein product [Spirodela intermedia]